MLLSLVTVIMLLGSTEPARPIVTLLSLDHPDAGAFLRIHTLLHVDPRIRLLPENEFTPEKQQAVRSTLSALTPFPDALVVAVLEKQRVHLKVDRLVILTAAGLYILDGSGQPRGPFPVPRPRDTLSESFLSALGFPTKPEKAAKPASTPLYRNWLFWTGMGIIVAGVVVMTALAQEPNHVEIHVIHR